jgi:hypothetical protein
MAITAATVTAGTSQVAKRRTSVASDSALTSTRRAAKFSRLLQEARLASGYSMRFSIEVLPLQPLIWAQPVILAFVLWRSM